MAPAARIVVTIRGDRKLRATPISCFQPRRHSSATTSAQARRDRFIIAMKANRAGWPGARRLAIFSELSDCFGTREKFSEAAIPSNGCVTCTTWRASGGLIVGWSGRASMSSGSAAIWSSRSSKPHVISRISGSIRGNPLPTPSDESKFFREKSEL